MNTGGLLTKAARAHPERVAVRRGPTSLTYAALNDAAGRFAAGMRGQGLARGDRVVIYSRNRPEYLIALLGTLKAGLVAVPVNARLHSRELSFIVADADARGVVYGSEAREAIEDLAAELSRRAVVRVGGEGPGVPLDELLSSAPHASRDEEVAPQDLAWLFYTSGTTGQPKGAMLSHRNLARMTVSCLADIWPFAPEDVVLHLTPFSHGSGLYLLPALARGAENLIVDSDHFEPEAVLELVQRERVTVIAFLVPTMIAGLLESDPTRSTDTIKRIVYGGSPILVEHARQAVERFGPVLVQLYGQGESPMTISYLRAEDHRDDDERVLASAGIPFTDVDVRVVDADDDEVPQGEVGQVVVRGDVVMQGYWRNAAATAEALRDGWLHTGDLGRFGADGRLYLVGRAKDVIISGGSNIYPREVEDVLVLHPGVRDVSVFGAPDEIWGESVVAAVVPEPEWKADAAELVEHCQRMIGSYKKPRRIEFVDELPKNGAGKILKRVLREHLAREVSSGG